MEEKQRTSIVPYIVWPAAILIGSLVVVSQIGSMSGIGWLSIAVLVAMTAAVQRLFRGVMHGWAWSALAASIIAMGALLLASWYSGVFEPIAHR